MSNDPLETLLRQWNDANLGRFIEPTRPCPDGPSLATLYLHIVEGLELSPRQTDHVETCPRCLHVRERIESLAGTLQFVGSHRRTARPLVDDAGRIRRFGHLFRWTPATSALSRRRWVMGGSLAAASVLIALLLLWPSGGTRPASAADLREVGFAPPLPLAAGWRNADDERLRQARQAVAEARVELDEALSAGQRDILDPWIAWTKLYRNLRVLGEWDEALEQMRAALAYAEAEDRKPARYSFYYVCLTDLGNTHSALGDYAAATSYHQKSFTVARDYQQWAHRSGLIADNTPRDYARAMVGTLVPRLWALSTLAAAQRDQEAAWGFHADARKLLTDYLRQECLHRNLSAGAQASVEDLCSLIVAVGDKGLESLIVKVREHLLRRAMLLRVDRNLDGATEALDIGAALPGYPFADESRLDFNEPMERLRIAIARGHFDVALMFADEAEANTGPRHFEGRPTHPPIGVIAHAELQFLGGVAKAGIDPGDLDALTTIESAIEAVEQSAASLPESRREQLLKRFAQWNHVGERIRGRVSLERDAP